MVLDKNIYRIYYQQYIFCQQSHVPQFLWKIKYHIFQAKGIGKMSISVSIYINN